MWNLDVGLLVLPRPPFLVDRGSSVANSIIGVPAFSKMNCAMRCLGVIVMGFVDELWRRTLISSL